LQEDPKPTNKELILFSEPSIRKMSNQITYFLKGVSDKDIIVPDEFIIEVSDSFYQNTPASLEQLQMMIVKYIVDYVKQEVYTIDKNNKLSITAKNYLANGWNHQSHAEWLEEYKPRYFADMMTVAVEIEGDHFEVFYHGLSPNDDDLDSQIENY
jgi:hypothetical protein